jgi:hypothetical protein
MTPARHCHGYAQRSSTRARIDKEPAMGAAVRAAALTAALAGTALLTAACGGGSSPSATAAQQGTNSRVAEALGEPSFPDPDNAGGFVMTPANSSLLGGNSPAWRACHGLMPKKGKPATPAEQEQHQRQNLMFDACVRRHGIPNFPDGWSGNVGQLISAGIDPDSSKLNAALTACGF